MKIARYLLSLFVVSMIVIFAIQSAKASDMTTYYKKVEDSYGVNGGMFQVNGIWAYCADCNKNAVPNGTVIKSITLSTNSKLRKVLWYGSIGPGAILDNDEDGWIQTAQATSLAMGNGTVNSRYKSWYESVIEKDAPPSGFQVYIATPEESSLQPLAYFIYEPVGKGQLKKESTSSRTEGNSNYSLENAKYGVYSNKACTKKVGTFITESDGKSNILELEPKTYYVKEITAPKGYELSEEVYTLVVEEDTKTVLKVKDVPIKGKFQIIKSSSNPDITDNNACYSLEGAEYGIYEDKACTTLRRTITTDRSGKTKEISMIAGVYYVKELKAPLGYALDESVHKVKIQADNTSIMRLEIEEHPQINPIELFLQKVEAQDSHNREKVSLEDAHYTVKYYPVQMDTDPALSQIEPTFTWVMRTDENGFIYFKEEYRISGDVLYVDENGNGVLPLGTITVQETKAPEGYLLNKEVVVAQITSAGTAVKVQTYEHLVVREEILKINIIKYQANSDIPIPGVVFEHVKPDGTSERMMTDENGKLEFCGLQYGEHKIRERFVMDGYQLHEEEIVFCVGEDNAISLISGHEDEHIEISVSDDGNIQLVMQDELTPYTVYLHKENDLGHAIEGTAFSVYEDETCEKELFQGVTDENGILKIDHLVPGKPYYVKETKAAPGYRSEDKVYEIMLDTQPTKEKCVFYVNGESREAVYTEAHMTIINKRGKVLPNTGSYWMYPMVILGLVLGIIGKRYRFEKKN